MRSGRTRRPASASIVSTERDLPTLDRADRANGDLPEAQTGRLRDKLVGLRRQMEFLREAGATGTTGPGQVSLTASGNLRGGVHIAGRPG